MKRLIALALMVGAMALSGCSGTTEGTDATNKTAVQSEETEATPEVDEVESPEESEETPENVTEEEKETAEIIVDRKSELETAIRSRISEGEYQNAVLQKITINDNLGANDGSYIALVNLKFDIKNSRSTANDIMKMYSDDLAATLANKGISDISELAIFWKDDYNSRDIKYSYEYRDGNFFIMDIAGE